MENRPQESVIWIVGLSILWTIFFLAGVLPSITLMLIRQLGGVLTTNSYLYSPYVITLGNSFYLYFFVHHRCKEAGLPFQESFVRALYVFILGTLAFLDLPIGALIHLSYFIEASDRIVILATIPLKGLAWFYLVGLFIRYYAFGGVETFVNLIITEHNKRKSEELVKSAFTSTPPETSASGEEKRD